MTYQEERIVQVLDYIAGHLPGKRLSKLNALKLVYLADRYHLRKYATPILWDSYYAMKYGPVASKTKLLIERICENPSLTSYISVIEASANKSRCGGRLFITSRKPFNADQLRSTEIEALDAAINQWPLHDDLVAFTHRFPEWRDFEGRFNGRATRFKMRYSDFFRPCSDKDLEYCNVSPEDLQRNQSIFEEEAFFRNFVA